MALRTTKEVKYLRYEFDNAEKLAMGSALATNHNRLADLKAEEAVFKAQMKDKLAGIELSIQGLSRCLYTGYEMRNIDCVVRWDSPNINEVEYVRMDTGEVALTRAMTEQERQQELEFAGKVIEFGPVAVEESTANIETFFGPDTTDARKAPVDPEDVFRNPDPNANLEAVKEEHDEAWANSDAAVDGGAKRGRGRPKKVVEETEDNQPF